ncbi:beta-glucosidase [Paraburkholderia azotifigens]|uniref:beta-glucosidase n=1 Tax=Paraburkholderia azotifigens TaxID=2057004 RepID=UPI003180744B
MFAGRIASCLTTSMRVLLLSAVAMWCAGVPTVLGAELTLNVNNPAGSLIAQRAGDMKIEFGIPPQEKTGSAMLRTSLLRYDGDGALVSDPIAFYQQAVTLTRQSVKATVSITIPRAGLFLVDATLLSENGKAVASKRVNVAAMSPRGRSSFPDFGVVTHFAQGKGAPEVLLPLVKSAGFSWIRDEIYWDHIEQKPGVFVFPKDYDAYLNRASKLGISPLIVLAYGNAKAYPELFGAEQSFPDSPEARRFFVRYVDEVVRRYGQMVTHWEVWNEPAFARLGYAGYVALLKPVYTQIKERSPQATVISCGGGGAGGGPGGDCLLEMSKSGALDYQDAFSVHPYMSPHIPETGYPTAGGPIASVSIPTAWPYLEKLTGQHPRTDGRRVQLWITELGWPSSPASAALDQTSQAAYLVRSYLLSRRYAGVTVMFWYDFVDDGNDPSNQEDNFGMLRNDLSPKPAYVASAVLNATLGSRKWHSALVDDENVKVFQYGNSEPVIVGWTTANTARVVSVQVPAGKYVQRDWQGAESQVTADGAGLKWRLGPLPSYLLPEAVVR